MIFKMAIKNVFRNSRRSILTGLAIFFAAFICVFSMGYMNGMLIMMSDNFTKILTGCVKVTTSNFAEREKFLPVDELVYDSGELMEKLRAVEGVTSVEERARFGILLGRETKTVAAFGMGIDLFNTVLDIKSNLVEGELEREGLYIGVKLAKKLGTKIGDELLLATNTSEGGLNGMKFRVNGFVQMQIADMDERSFFISIDDAKKLLKIEGASTEIYIYSKIKEMDAVKERIAPLLNDRLTSRTAREQVGTLWDVLSMYRIFLFFFEILILALASFVVVNTMMQAIFERMKEIGTLKAVGMTDKELSQNFIFEGGFIGALGGIPGAVLGYLFTLWVRKVGINVETVMQGMDFPVNYIIRPYAGFELLPVTVILSILVPAVAAYFPARYAKNLSAAEALRKI